MTRETDLADLIHAARGTMDAAQASIELAQRVIAQAHSDIETARRSIAELAETTQAHVIAELPASTAPITEHRRNHRPGRPAVLDTDPELRAFVLARIDRMTFHEIEAEIALQYPVERRVKKSAIHAWWKKTRARHTPAPNAQQ
ncbi:hypothetical protein ACVDG3_15980 [Meridianimarinicoccus sp. RP-17]|uniref:hypothetical protein n=1 Tax=Meridianimarinicoccus zhengii TaxID=2056810 RepID=UPI000DAF45D7|nr:hypothetical protein [Phycocomes zhengii]